MRTAVLAFSQVSRAEFYYLSQIQHNLYIKNPDGPYDAGKQQQKIPVQMAQTDERICGELFRRQ